MAGNPFEQRYMTIVGGRVISRLQSDALQNWNRQMHSEPFVLGFEGEQWNSALGCLVVPVPDSDRCVLVRKHPVTHDRYNVVTNKEWRDIPDMIMVAAVVQDFINNYHITLEGNHGQAETNPEA